MQAALALTNSEDNRSVVKKEKKALSTDVLEHIQASFTELAASTLAAANSAVTSETEAKAYSKPG